MGLALRTLLLLLVPSVNCAVWLDPIPTSTAEVHLPGNPSRPRLIAANSGNYTISFVPLITLLSGIVPRIIQRMRTPTTDARELEIPQPTVMPDFEESNPCIDSILGLKPYPGDVCFFYQCQLADSANAKCRSEVVQDPYSPLNMDYRSVERKSSVLRISECLAIRLYRCSAGHVYDQTVKKCIRQINLDNEEPDCPSR